jgi:hypothetical protein
VKKLTIHLVGPEYFQRMNSLALFMHYREEGKSYVAEPIVFKERVGQQLNSLKPCLEIEEDQHEGQPDKLICLQGLMDDLWRLGYRPTEAHAGDARVQALNDHLEDMRAIAFHKLSLSQPNLGAKKC